MSHDLDKALRHLIGAEKVELISLQICKHWNFAAECFERHAHMFARATNHSLLGQECCRPMKKNLHRVENHCGRVGNYFLIMH